MDLFNCPFDNGLAVFKTKSGDPGYTHGSVQVVCTTCECQSPKFETEEYSWGGKGEKPQGTHSIYKEAVERAKLWWNRRS